MAYIPGYTYDIFISYAHLDNLKLPGQQRGWIELFYESLNLKLAQRIGKLDAVKIWWDSKKLDGSRLFDASIEEGIRNSAIMISLLSPAYLQSDYCRQEMDLFYNKSVAEKAGRSIGDRARMIKVLLNNIPHTQTPEKFGRATGFPFYKSADNNDFGERLDYLDPGFTVQLKALQDALIAIFEAFPKDQAVRTDSTPSAQTDAEGQGRNFKIYFGEVSDSLRTARKRTMTELAKGGFSMLTNIPPPDEAAAHEQKVVEVLKQADLAVHLLDQFPGREIEGGEGWYTMKQVELSMQHAPAKLIWIPADLVMQDVEEEVYKTFLQGLEQANSSENKFEFIRGTRSELFNQIRDYAEALIQSRQRKESNEKISVLLDTHFSDQEYAFSLGQALLQHNMQPYINPQEDDPRKNIQMLSDRISQVNKLVFLYGHVSREWVLERMSAALQLIVTNNYPIDDFYIYMAPPNKGAEDIKLNQRFLKVNVLNNSAEPGLNAKMLDTFISDLKQRSVA